MLGPSLVPRLWREEKEESLVHMEGRMRAYFPELRKLDSAVIFRYRLRNNYGDVMP